MERAGMHCERRAASGPGVFSISRNRQVARARIVTAVPRKGGVHRITDTIVSEAASAVSAREKRGYPDIEGLLLSEA